MRAGPKTTPAPTEINSIHTRQTAAHHRDQHSAARVVASHATDIEDCRVLLEMLGLNGAVGLPVFDPPERR